MKITKTDIILRLRKEAHKRKCGIGMDGASRYACWLESLLVPQIRQAIIQSEPHEITPEQVIEAFIIAAQREQEQ